MTLPRIHSLPIDWSLLALTGALMMVLQIVPPTSTALATGAMITGGSSDRVHVSTRLDRTKVMRDSDGTVRMEITLRADEVRRSIERMPTDVVVVLDKSGSMAGDKINYAKSATRALVDLLGADDRFALVTYDDHAQWVASSQFATPVTRAHWRRAIDNVGARGSTNMSEGIDGALMELEGIAAPGRAARIILISDGLPNRGDATVEGLIRRARKAAGREFVLTSVGVGEDFNERLMTALADAGTGNYYYLQNGTSLAEVFEDEFRSAGRTVASGLEIKLDLGPGVTLIDAAGYPIRTSGQQSAFTVGPMLGGQERSFWITLQADTERKGSINLGELEVDWSEDGTRKSVRVADNRRVEMVGERKQYLEGLDKDAWAQSVVTEEYNRLRQDVSAAVQDGRKEEAQRAIQSYKTRVSADNAYVGSSAVMDNLAEVDDLDAEIEEAFTGAAPAQEQKRNTLSKSQSAGAWKARRR
jgi:Ca-activated chloride channel homolog